LSYDPNCSEYLIQIYQVRHENQIGNGMTVIGRFTAKHPASEVSTAPTERPSSGEN